MSNINTYDPYSEKVISKFSDGTNTVGNTSAAQIESGGNKAFYGLNDQYRVIRHILGNELNAGIDPLDSFIIDTNGIRCFDSLGNEKFSLSKSGVLNVHDNIKFDNGIDTGNVSINAFGLSFDNDIEVIGKSPTESIIAGRDNAGVLIGELIMRNPGEQLIFRKASGIETILVP